MSVVIETTLGDITIDLYLKERPNTCLNFLKLCKIKYYNLCLFHKIERNFIAQSGDPTGTGRGGESLFCHLYGDQAKYFDSEAKPRLKHEKLGTISMVNNGNNMNGSQFFITLGENLTYLDEVHNVFGEVVEGFGVLLKLNEAICDNNNRPYQDIRITHTVILHDPYEDPKGLEIPDASPEPTMEQLESGYIAADEEIDDTKGKTAEEIEEKIKESEAKARATILEMVGDIPDAEVKPPENVLFVCKLNPVTTSEDLEIIFSRFGTIVSCEVIKDKKTGDSLQYAFIEFEKEEDCENAYFKMDNVLIDDRRIHVDFSQSVSKLYWDKGSKFQKNRASKQNVVLKNDSKGTDGYELIFDENPKEVISNKKNKHRSKTPENKHSHSKKLNERNRHRSKSPALKRRKHDEGKEYFDDHKTSMNSKSYKNYANKDYKQKEYRSHNRFDDRNYNESSKPSSRSSSKGYRRSEQSKRSLESYSEKHYESSRNRYKQDSVSPRRERQKTYDRKRHKSPAYDCLERNRYSGKLDQNDDHKRDKKCKSSHKEAKKSKNLNSSYSKKYVSEKTYHSGKKYKSKKKSRSSSVSSSSTSSSTIPVAKSKQSKKQEVTSSDSGTSTDSSSDEKNKKYQHKKKKQAFSPVSKDNQKRYKKSRYSS